MDDCIKNYQLKLDNTNRIKMELSDLQEDLEMIFQDLIDMGEVSDFKSRICDKNGPENQYVIINFTVNFYPDRQDLHKNTFILSEVYKNISQSLERIQSMHNVESHLIVDTATVLPSSKITMFYKYWSITFKIK